MLFPKSTRYLVIPLLAACCLLFCVAPARAQYKIDLQTCEDLKIAEMQYGISVVETATCIKPTKTFQPKGTLRNVNLVATFPAVPTGAGDHLHGHEE